MFRLTNTMPSFKRKISRRFGIRFPSESSNIAIQIRTDPFGKQSSGHHVCRNCLSNRFYESCLFRLRKSMRSPSLELVFNLFFEMTKLFWQVLSEDERIPKINGMLPHIFQIQSCFDLSLHTVISIFWKKGVWFFLVDLLSGPFTVSVQTVFDHFGFLLISSAHNQKVIRVHKMRNGRSIMVHFNFVKISFSFLSQQKLREKFWTYYSSFLCI